MTCISGNYFTKDPNATLDYTIDWSAWLDGDTIDSASWVVDSGITMTDEDNDTENTQIWLSGGTAGQIYSATSRIVTAAGRQDDRTIRIKVIEK